MRTCEQFGAIVASTIMILLVSAGCGGGEADLATCERINSILQSTQGFVTADPTAKPAEQAAQQTRKIAAKYQRAAAEFRAVLPQIKDRELAKHIDLLARYYEGDSSLSDDTWDSAVRVIIEKCDTTDRLKRVYETNE